MNVGIVCYASVGGSGIVATELAKGLARRGHEVRLISSEPPVRLGDFQAGLAFHAVRTPGYPLFREPQYLLTLANKIVEVCREGRLDIIHAHYAVPHATAAYLETIVSWGSRRALLNRTRVVRTQPRSAARATFRRSDATDTSSASPRPRGPHPRPATIRR